jgi:excisionase family DNA binding protein
VASAKEGGTVIPMRRRDAPPDSGGSTGHPLVLSVGEAAGMLGVSKSLVYDLITRGELPGLRLGRRVVVPTQALLALIAGPL